MVTSFFTHCSPILSANSPKNDPPEPGEHLYKCRQVSVGRAAALLRCGVRKMKEKPHWPGRSRVRAAVETPGPIRGATISCQAAAE